MKRSSTFIGTVCCLTFAWACNQEGDEATERIARSLGEGLLLPVCNDAGKAQSATATGTVDTGSPFFTSLGSNGRTCGTCHLTTEGWTITPAGVRARFDASGGLDPIFRPHDGANAPALDVSTVEARRYAYSLLLDRAVIRIGLPVKPTSEFELIAVDDPYGHASAAQLSLFRRPLPTTNLRFLTAINWDGRNTPATDLTNIRLGLENQANGATVNHAQAAQPIDQATRQAIVDLELSLVTAQIKHDGASDLTAYGARGGPQALLTLPFAIGANDPAQPGFDRNVFRLYDAWAGLGSSGVNGQRVKVNAGQRVFNTKTFSLPGGGTATCSSCHTIPDVGGASSFRMIDIGISDPARRSNAVPLYTFRNKTTGAVIQTTDPGRALITGLWADMNRFKVPGLRALAARAPYFHDGSARSLGEVVNHYQARFSIQFSYGEKDALIKFLETL
jgi:cytochrome c peroxidase